MRGFQFSIAFSLVRKVIARLPQAVAVITAVSLIQTSVAGQAFAAFSAPERTDYTAAAAMAQPPVPFSAGRVTGARYFGSEKTVVVIQDLHCHGEVQRNIARILERLDGSYGLSHVFVEGASGPVDTSWTALAGDGSARRETVETLLAAGRLTGAEYYAINAGRPVLISGLEDEPLYRENLARLGEIIRRRQDVSAVMKNINASLAALKGRYFSPENLKLERLMAGRRAGTVDSERYYRTLARYAEKKGIDLYDYPAVTGYCTVAQMRKRLHARAAMRELEKYTAFLKETLPYAEYAALSAERGRDTEGFYLQLASVARERGIKLRDRYPELDKFFSFLALSRALNPLELAGQERRLSRTLRTACAKSGAEKEAAFIAGYASYVDDFLNARISEEDYRYFTLNYPAFTSLWHKYVSSREIPSFGARYALSNDFYRANLERNRRFIGNMLGDTRDGAGRMFAMSPEEHSKNVLASLKKARVSVMVAGGFHTGGITELLGRKKISYAVVTPNVSGDVSFACSTYEALAREQAAAINGQTISLRLYSQRLLETPAEKRAELLKKDTVEAALTLAFQKNKDLSPERIAAAINANLGEYDGTIIYKKDFNGPGGRYVYTYRGESGSARLYITHDPASGTATTTEEVEPAAQEARKQPFMTARFLESCFRADMKRTVLLLAPVIENGSVLLIPTFIHAAVFMLSGNLSASLALFAVSALAGCWFMSYVFHQTVFEQGKEQPRDSTGVERSMIFRLFTAEVAVGFVCSLVTLYLGMPAWVTAAAVPSITFLASAVLHAGYNQQALEAGVGELFLTGGGGASPASGSIVDDQVEYLALSERALRKIYRSFIPLLAAAGFSFGPITGLNVRLAAAEQPVIVTASEIRQLGWPAILKAAKLHAKAVSYPREDGGAALYPRLIKADGNDLFGSLEEMYQMEEELNIGYGARLENGEPVAGSPFTMKETGTTVDYAVFNDFGDSPVLYRGNIPDDISRKAGLICMLNAARVNRPSRQGTGVRRLTGNEDSALLITPRGMITSSTRSPSGRMATITRKRCPVMSNLTISF